MTRAKRLLFLYCQHRLIDHTEVSYIQSTGTQWIDTGIVGKNGLKIEVKYSPQTNNGNGGIIGSRITSGDRNFSLLRSSSNLLSGYNWGQNTVDSIVVGDIYTAIKDDNLTYIDGVLVNTTTKGAFANNLNMYIFAINNNNSVALCEYMKLYYLKIWDNEVLLRHFIPVLKNEDYCMYDNVSRTYFYNMGSGSFLGG